MDLRVCVREVHRKDLEFLGGGGSQIVENIYTYTKDKLTSIGHNGFSYGFVYDGKCYTETAII